MKRAWLFLFVFMFINLGFVSAGILFESDWSTGTGTNDSVLRDTNKTLPWDVIVGTGRIVVISAAGLDFPTTNVLQVDGIRWQPIQWINTRSVYVHPNNNHWPIPAVGESLYFRLYKRLVYPTPQYDNLSNNNHPFEESVSGDRDWSWTFQVNNNGWRPGLQFRLTGPVTRFRLGPQSSPIYLARNATYRIEWQLKRVGTSSLEGHARIYNSAGALLYSDVNFVNESNANQSLANNVAVEVGGNLSNFDGLIVGTNGPGISDPGEDIVPMWYFGAVCVRDDDWCGAYNASQGGQNQSNDTTAPVRSSGSPSGVLPYNTTQTTLSLTTDEATTCRYSTTANTVYSSMTNTFATTGSTTHQQTISNLIFNTTYNYYVRCNDTANNVNANDFNITFIVSHGPDFTYNWNDWWTNETINFSLYNVTYLQNVSDVKFVNQYGRIQFLQNLNLSSDLNLAERIKVLDKKIWINSSLIPQFNKSAMLTFTGVGFSNPIIKIDGVDCPATRCQNVTFNQTTGQYTFNVTGFSVYEIVEQCEDNVQNYDETGKDCGGKCGECRNNGWIWILVGVLVIAGLVWWFGGKGKRR